MSFIIENGVLKEYSPPKTEVIIPDGVTSIGDCAFEYCGNIQSIKIPNSVTSIGNHAFEHCKRLHSMTIPDGVTSIGNYAFADCSQLQSITIPNSVTSIGRYAFEHCKFKIITIPDSVRKIEEGAFAWCHFIRPTIIIPDSGIYIDCMAFTPVGGRITFKSKDFQVSCPCWLWGQCGEDKKLARFYNDPATDNFDKIKETDYKIPMALLRFFGHDEEEYHDYIKRHITQIANLMINENNCILINKILAAGFVTKNNINRLIDHAEEKEQTEITALLKEHKNKHFGNVSINKEV